tara:strand:+ start:62 stop:232 length:171 start_codon:yes stop_codon:yes gene_type:complete
MTTQQQLKAARAKVNSKTFGTGSWEKEMETVRELCAKLETEKPAYEMTYVDNSWHI